MRIKNLPWQARRGGSSRDSVLISLEVARSFVSCDLSSAIHPISFSAALLEPSQVKVWIFGLNRAAAMAVSGILGWRKSSLCLTTWRCEPGGFRCFVSVEDDFSARSATSAAPPILGCGLSVLVEVFIYSSTNSIISNIPYTSNTHSKINHFPGIHQPYDIYPPLYPFAFAQPSLISWGGGKVMRIHCSAAPFGITHKFILSCLNNTLGCRIVGGRY